MRVSPIGLVFHKDMQTAVRHAAASSDVTHPYPTNAEACVVYTRLLVLCLQGASKATLADDLLKYDFRDPDLSAAFKSYHSLASFAEQAESKIHSTGYVVYTLEAALWCFFTTDDFRTGALKAVNLGSSYLFSSFFFSLSLIHHFFLPFSFLSNPPADLTPL